MTLILSSNTLNFTNYYPAFMLLLTLSECDYCVHLLIDDLDGLANHVTVVTRTLADVSVGVGAFNQLSHFNETVEMLRVSYTEIAYLYFPFRNFNPEAQ